MPDALPSFALDDQHRRAHSFPGGRPALLCFVKEDCPTCGLTMPLIEAAHRGLSRAKSMCVAIGQDAAGNAKLVERHALTAPMLDDSALKVSFAYDLDTVPTIILADARGSRAAPLRRLRTRPTGSEMLAELARLSGESARRQSIGESYPRVASRMRLEIGRARNRGAARSRSARRQADARGKSSSATTKTCSNSCSSAG